MRAILKDGKVINMHYSNYKDGAYNYFTGVYMPPRCQTCLDGSGEFSDLAVSDAWTRDEQGEYKFKAHSRILIRTARGHEILANAIRRGALITHDVSMDRSYATHQLQTKRKGTNAPLRVARLARAGKLVPIYDRTAPAVARIDEWKERVVSQILALGRYRAFRYSLIKLLTSKMAIPLIQFRQWRKRRKYRK
jgi:coenzyme F420 hydrogenase subunit beta